MRPAAEQIGLSRDSKRSDDTKKELSVLAINGKNARVSKKWKDSLDIQSDVKIAKIMFDSGYSKR